MPRMARGSGKVGTAVQQVGADGPMAVRDGGVERCVAYLVGALR